MSVVLTHKNKISNTSAGNQQQSRSLLSNMQHAMTISTNVINELYRIQNLRI